MKILTLFFIMISFVSYSQRLTIVNEIRTDSITGNGQDSIGIGDKMYYIGTPTITEDGDIIYKSYADGRYLGLTKYGTDSTAVGDSLAQHRTDIDAISQDFWPLSGNFSTGGAQDVTIGGKFNLTNSTSDYESLFSIPLAEGSTDGVRMQYNWLTPAGGGVYYARTETSDKTIETGYTIPSGGPFSALLADRPGNSTRKSSFIGAHSNGNIYVGKSLFSLPNNTFGAITYMNDYSSEWVDGGNNGTLTLDLIVPHVKWVSSHLGYETFTPPTASEDGQSIRWNNPGNTWEYYTPGGGNFIPLSGTPTLTGNLTINTPIGNSFIVQQNSIDKLSIGDSYTILSSDGTFPSSITLSDFPTDPNLFLFKNSGVTDIKMTYQTNAGASAKGYTLFDSNSGNGYFEFRKDTLSATTYAIVRGADPVGSQDLATKQYVDANSGGVNEAYVASSIDSVDTAGEIGYTPTETNDYPGTDPDDVAEALDSLASFIQQLTGGMRIAEIQIGDWNMDATSNINVELPSYIPWNNARILSVMIRDDSPTASIHPLDKYNSPLSVSPQGGPFIVYNPTDCSCANGAVNLVRLTGGLFDATSFDATSYNRGWVVIAYQP